MLQYLKKLAGISDTPHKIATGFAIGVFLGILPFAGPVLALFVAGLLKVNRVSAFLGALVTNTWITIAAFLLSVKIGSFLFGVNQEAVRSYWAALFKNFNFSDLFKLSFFNVVLPVVTGYLVIALSVAIFSYVVVLVIVGLVKNKRTH
ncbi:MAG: DUF2062 domain-containing protein [Candidatus Omnitrophica bacterium]|nr:DUF2062 domain-containing protein [Candidatus Omnitrophota bacterium]MDD5436661.1 DUF2062 domain-containing protein [Candidatus Omnitrophota bacterium]